MNKIADVHVCKVRLFLWAYFLLDILIEYGYNKNTGSVNNQIHVLRGEWNERIMC